MDTVSPLKTVADRRIVVGFDLNGTLLRMLPDKSLTEIAGAREMLRTLKKRGISFFVASNNDDDGSGMNSAQKFDKVFGDEFSGTPVFMAASPAERKPSAFMLEKGFKFCSAPNDFRIFVGDQRSDVEAANNANAHGMLFRQISQDTDAATPKGAASGDVAYGHESVASRLVATAGMFSKEIPDNRIETRGSALRGAAAIAADRTASI